MINRLQISTRKASLSKVALDTIKSKVNKLDKFYDRIISCKVTVDTPHRHKNHGKEYNVSIDIVVPGSDIFVKNERHEDLYVAIREAFESAKRQLQNFNQKQKGKKPKVLAQLAKETIASELEEAYVDTGRLDTAAYA